MANKQLFTIASLLIICVSGYAGLSISETFTKISEDTTGTTIFRIQEDTLYARPDRGFKFEYHFQGTSVGKSYKIRFQLVNQSDETVFEEAYYPPLPSYQWNGDVRFDHLVTLPVWEIINNRTVNVQLPEGIYDVVAGLYDEINSINMELKTGPGVTVYKQGLYKIGILKLESLAPIPDPGKPSLNLEDYYLSFNEEFDSLSVSSWGPAGEGGSTWIAHTPWYGDFGDAKFTNPGLGFPFTISNSILRIEAAKKDGEWKSGLLSAVDPDGKGFKQKFGYFECRAKLPEGPGVWPAFWLMGTKNRWATGPRINPEVDILEQYGHWPYRFSFALHLWGIDGLPSSHEGERIKVLGMQDDFHNYGMLIEEDSMFLYFDGVEMYRRDTPKELNTPLYPLVNLTLGPGWPLDKTPDPSYMYVDYVKIYDRYFRSDILDIDWDKKLIKASSGIYRDSLLYYLDVPQEMDIELRLSSCREDSLCKKILTGDSLFVKVSGDEPQLAFRFEVEDHSSSGLEVTFIVKDDQGLLVEGAEIFINSDTLITNGNGMANLFLSGDEYSYSVIHDDYSANGIVHLEDQAVTETVILQQLTYPLRISVMLGSEPVSNAIIIIDGRYFLTDAEGEAIVELPAGNHDYVVSVRGYEDHTGTVEISDNGEDLVINFQELALKDNSFEEIGIYPNPSNGEFVIERKFNDSRIEVRITDIRGRQIFSKKYDKEQKTTITLKNPEQGIYILKLTIDDVTDNRMIIIE